MRLRGRKADRVPYGAHKAQFVEVWDAPGTSALTAVFVHGGFWRSNYKLDLMDALCADAVQRGWRAVNVEYRRERGWSAMADDVRGAWALAVDVAGQDPIVTVGHSAGGHLGLWAAASCEPKPALAVSLGGVVDLALADELNLGVGAVRALLGAAPLSDADPAQLVPSRAPTLLVAPRSDFVVPREVSASYADKAQAAGDDVTMIEPPGDHFSVIDPASEAWAETCAHIQRAVVDPPPPQPVTETRAP